MPKIDFQKDEHAANLKKLRDFVNNRGPQAQDCMKLEPDCVHKMIEEIVQKEPYYFYCLFLNDDQIENHLKLKRLEFFSSCAGEELMKTIISEENYHIVQGFDAKVLKFVMSLEHSYVHDMLTKNMENHYNSAFICVIKEGDLELLKFFSSCAGEDLMNRIISKHNYYVVRYVATQHCANLSNMDEVLTFLLSIKNVDVQAIISTNDYEMLDNPSVFAYAVINKDKYKLSACLDKFVNSKLSNLATENSEGTKFYLYIQQYIKQSNDCSRTGSLCALTAVRLFVEQHMAYIGFLDAVDAALNTLINDYASGAAICESMNSIRNDLNELRKAGELRVSFSLDDEKRRDKLTHIQQALQSLDVDKHFEGKFKIEIYSLLRYICNGITTILSWIGAPKDRNLLAERMINRPFFFQHSKSEAEAELIRTSLQQATNNLISALKTTQPTENLAYGGEEESKDSQDRNHPTSLGRG